MLQGLYSSATALDAATTRHEVVARNLAHINVPGFRRSVVANETFEMQFDEQLHTGGNLGTHIQGIATDFTTGALQKTGRPLDLALSGDGFFVLDGPDGPLYTRNGVFHIDNQSQLVTAAGIVVEGENGPITIPEGVSPTEVFVGKDGVVRVSNGVDSQEVGKLKTARFEDNRVLIPVGTTAFEAPPGVVSQDAEAVVVQGVRESSNVSAVTELIQLINASRYFEASQRAMQATADAVQNNTDPSTG